MEPIVFVPGLLCTETLFAPQIVAFADRPLMVADHRRHNAIREIAGAVLEEAPDRFALAGLSMGGYVALEIIRLAPERVSRLALLNTTARPDTPEQTARRKELIEAAKTGHFDTVGPALFPTFVHENRAEDAELRQTVLDMAAETGPDAFVRQQTAIMNRDDARARLPEIACPTLVIVGDGDRLTPPDRAEEMHQAIPGSRLDVISNCGHLSTLEQPEALIASLTGWLNS